jgi:hypothetical protein
VLIYVLVPGLEHQGPLGQFAKYLLAIALVLCFALLAVTRPRINRSPLFPLAALLLSMVGGISFAYSLFVAPGMGTYASALIPLVVAAIPLLIDTHMIRTDGYAATEYLFSILGIAAFFHVLWDVVQIGLTGNENPFPGWLAPPSKSSGMVIVFFMLLCGLFRRNLLLILSVALVGVSELLAPTSTLAFLTMFAAGVIVLHRLRFGRFLRLACVIVAVGIIIANLAIFESSDIADALYSIEPSVKEDLGSESDSDFRLAVLSAARDESARHSMLVGQAFTGELTVNTLPYLPSLSDDKRDIASNQNIHSDFAILIVQGGLIGYALFTSVFVGMALLCAKAAQLAHAARDRNSETLFDALQAMNIAFMLCVSGNPMMADLQGTAPYLILLPLATFLARAQPGFARPQRAVCRR